MSIRGSIAKAAGHLVIDEVDAIQARRLMMLVLS
jgi:hypothetical protein